MKVVDRTKFLALPIGTVFFEIPTLFRGNKENVEENLGAVFGFVCGGGYHRQGDGAIYDAIEKMKDHPKEHALSSEECFNADAKFLIVDPGELFDLKDCVDCALNITKWSSLFT